jgi:hypothetical protein
MTDQAAPQTLTEAIKYFSNPDVTLATMIELRWPNGVHCPTCGRADVRFIATRKMWECKEKHSRRQFSAKVGTIFEDSPLGLDKWFCAIWMVVNCKNGVSSYEMHRALGVTQKTSWFMDHRVRLAMKAGSIEKMAGDVEADESFIGGLSKNMHKHKRSKITGTGGAGKTAVMGILRRSDKTSKSKVRAKVIPNTQAATLQPEIRKTVEPGSRLFTDAWASYRGLGDEYQHEVIRAGSAFLHRALSRISA